MPTTRARRTSKAAAGLVHGYRSGLEKSIGAQLQAAGIDAEYEAHVLHYAKPETQHRYTPDWVLPNGIVIESKGRFLTADRQKHLLVQAQHPEKDIRFVFSNSNARISKTSKTTYAAWCRKHGFLYADKLIPVEWLKEKRK